MLSAIAPRPIAFASTVDANGVPNLAPFSFFNAFGSKPPVVVFSPARRVRDNTIKHTLENIYETKEVVINAVSYSMVRQMSLASSEYPKGVNEFIKAGFTPLPSQLIKPFRVKESPVQMECKVLDVVETGMEGGAANLIICEILLMHIDDSILNSEQKIDPDKIDLVARMGGDMYCRASGSAIFHVAKPLSMPGIGIDRLPAQIRNSDILTGNNLGQLGNVSKLPEDSDIEEFKNRKSTIALLESLQDKGKIDSNKLHNAARSLLDEEKVEDALLLLSIKY